jgi:hypothetical protein
MDLHDPENLGVTIIVCLPIPSLMIAVAFN